MKRIFFATPLLIIATALTFCACGKDEPSKPNNSEPGKDPEVPSYAFKEMPKLIVSLGATISDVEKAEKEAGSTIRERKTAAGYTTMGFDTKDTSTPHRFYMFRDDVGKLTIASLIVVPNTAIWEGEELNKKFIDLFTEGGYLFKVRTNHDGLRSFFFIKNDPKDGFTHIECRVNKEAANNNYIKEECTRLSYRRTDVVD